MYNGSILSRSLLWVDILMYKLQKYVSWLEWLQSVTLVLKLFKMALVIVNLQLTVVYRTWRRLGCSPSPRTPTRSLHQGAGIAPTPGRSYNINKYTSLSVIITVTSSTRTSDLPVNSPLAAVYPHSNQPALHTLLMSYIPIHCCWPSSKNNEFTVSYPSSKYNCTSYLPSSDVCIYRPAVL